MIIDMNRYNGGGGSGSGVTPAQVQQQIDSALTPYWDSAVTESAITEAVSGLATEQYVQDALSGVSLEGYWNSAQTEDAISAATSGKADAANTEENIGGFTFPKWNTQGIITGKTGTFYLKKITLNGNGNSWLSYSNYITQPNFYAPTTSGNPGEFLVADGTNTPKWSAVTGPDMSLYTPTSGFSTINGSAITNGGNIVIQGGGDMSGYWNSAETKSYVDSAATNLQDQIDTMDEVIADALVDLNDRVDAVSAATQDMVTSTDVRHMVKLSQAAYDQLSVKDPETFYIIVNE